MKAKEFTSQASKPKGILRTFFRWWKKVPVLESTLTEAGAKLMALDALRSLRGTRTTHGLNSLKLLRR